MNVYLPLFNIFEENLVLKKYRNATQDEIRQSNYDLNLVTRGIPIYQIILENHLQSAMYMANKGEDNQLEFAIDDIIEKSKVFKVWRSYMPSKIPQFLWNYQNRYAHCNVFNVDKEINNIGIKLSVGQTLIHGGYWYNHSTDTIITDRPLSTTFCPQVALRNAEWCGKAYDNERIDIMVLRVLSPRTNVYVFKQKGTDKGHEKEVVFASGAKLTKVKEHYITHRTAYKSDNNSQQLLEKLVPIYVLEVNIS